MITNSRLLDGLLALLLLVAGFLWLGHAERSIWLNAPPNSLDRFAIDRVMPDLPARLPAEDLSRLCLPRPWWRSLLERNAIAACLDGSLPKATHLLDDLETQWMDAINGQILFAHDILLINHETALPVFKSLRDLHRRLQDESGGPVFQAALRYGLLPARQSTPQFDEAGRADTAAVAGYFETALDSTEKRFWHLRSALASAGDSERWWLVRELGLLATGRMLEHDNARQVPSAILAVDRAVLASSLERMRRAAPRAREPLDRMLTGFLRTMTLSAGFAVAVAAILRAAPMLVAALFLLATLGGQHLLDVAVTGPPALRHLPTRDFVEGFAGLWGAGELWGPAVVFAAALAVSRFASARPGMNTLLRIPIPQAAAGIAGLFATALFVPLSPALRTEFLNFIAASAVATWSSRYGPAISQGASSWRLTLFAAPIVVAAFFSGFLGSFSRVDPLGSAGVAALVMLILSLILAGSWATRGLLLILLGLGLWGYGYYLLTGDDASGLIAHLPRHGVQRFLAAYDSLHHGAPDVRQVRWLIAAAEWPGDAGSGWGWGNVPWRGLPGNSSVLPVAAVSDLSFVLVAAVGGVGYGFTVVGILAALLILLISRGFALAFGDEARLAQRFFACIGAVGLTIALLRLIVNLAGTLQLLPLAGVPIPFLAHAPAANGFVLIYTGLVLGASPVPRRSS